MTRTSKRSSISSTELETPGGRSCSQDGVTFFRDWTRTRAPLYRSLPRSFPTCPRLPLTPLTRSPATGAMPECHPSNGRPPLRCAFVFVRVCQPDGTLEPPQLLDVLQEPGTGDYVWLPGKRRVEIRESVRARDGGLRYLIAVDAPPPGQTKRRPDSGVLSTSLDSSLGVEVEVTAGAAETIVDRGGRLYLWQSSVGDAWARDRLAFNEPDLPTTFLRIPAGLISVMIAGDVELPETLRISVHRLLPRRLHVEWDGEAWGRRGGSDG